MKRSLKDILAESNYLYGSPGNIDLKFAEFISHRAGDNASELLFLSTVTLSCLLNQFKHICLNLDDWAGRSVADFFSELPISLKFELGGWSFPESTEDWRLELEKSGVVGKPGEFKPLVLDAENHLYLYRYWNYEQSLASRIRSRYSADSPKFEPEILKECLDKYFPSNKIGSEPDWQKVAAFSALKNNFCVISGGPGTGKTTTAAGIMAVLQELAHLDGKALSMELLAPTGKAAARLQEAVKFKKAVLPCSETIKESIPESASTIHRFLGSRENSPYFYHNRDNPVSADVLIVDEASMVPLPLMVKLLEALPEKTKLILLGDRNQLASVESGAVLADICDVAPENKFSPEFSRKYQALTGLELECVEDSGEFSLVDSVVTLEHSYRFKAESGIGLFCREVNAGNSEIVQQILEQQQGNGVELLSMTSENFYPAFRELIRKAFLPVLNAGTLEEAFALNSEFRILCALKNGEFGTAHLNRMAEEILGVVTPRDGFYHGCPIMITRNDYNLKLFNGDTGLVWNFNGVLRGCFPGEDGSFRSFSLGKLTDCQKIYAMTIHKAQGSEFNQVLMVLPDHESQILNRELIYTGLSRAKDKVFLVANFDILKGAVQKKTSRTSGFRDAILTAPDFH